MLLWAGIKTGMYTEVKTIDN